MRFTPSLIDRYLLGSMIPPMAVAFAVVLVSLLLYRILEIFNLLASSSAQFELVSRMIAALLPHYLGLALPAGFFISILVVVARMGDASEIDALLASGVSMERLTAPFMAASLIVCVASALLLGYLQPYGRYDYNAGLNQALGAGWNARLQSRTFLAPSERFVLSADRADATGRGLEGVFLRRLDAAGQEQLFTARRGMLRPSADGRQVQLVLIDGQQLVDRPGGPVVGAFQQLEIEAPAAAAAGLFRSRGETARELTFGELLARMSGAGTDDNRRRAASEFHTRAVRSVSPLFLPLLAVPLGMAAKRGRRTGGFILAAVTLLLYQYGIDMTQALADLGLADPATAVWSAFAVFAGLCSWVYATSRNRPGETPLSALVDAIGAFMEGLRSIFRRRRARLT
jgi:lipopolysaccharide export system permease protein